MALLIDNSVTRQALDTAEAVEVMDDAFAQLSEGKATFQPLTNVVTPVTEDGNYHWNADTEFYNWGSHLGAIEDPPRLALRFKSDIRYRETRDGAVLSKKYNVEPGTYMGFILLFDTSTGALIGLLNDGEIQHIRVGASAGVACDHLARRDASTAGILGSGGMARTYLEAFAAVRDLEHVEVYSPTQAHRKEFAETMGETLDITVRAVDDPETAMTDVDIAATCTDARTPVYFEEWLSPGTFLTNAASTELTDAVYESVDRIVTNHNHPSHYYIIGSESDERAFHDFFPGRTESTDYELLADAVSDPGAARRNEDECILYDNMHIGIQFAAVGNLVYERAKERGLGIEIPLSWFQQDVRN